MTSKELKEKLLELEACGEAVNWSDGKSWQEVYNTCHRGDWLLWLFAKTNSGDKRIMCLVAGHCANTVRHLMKDQRSLDAVDAAIKYGNSGIDEKEFAAAYASDAAAAAAAADAAAYAYAYAAAADAADAAAYVTINRQQTADIVRKLITIEKFNL